MTEIIPGILEKEFSEIIKKIDLIRGIADWVQIDFADNTLIPNTTCLDFEKFSSITGINLEAHLMVSEPQLYIRKLADAGFQRIIAHVECTDPRLFLEQIRYESAEAGMAIDGATEIEQIEPFLGEVDTALDTVLIMTIEAGASGQKFLPETIEKIKAVHEHRPDLAIEVDGGINDQTVRFVKDAGATRIVSTSYIFKNPHLVAEAMEQLRNA